MKVLLAMSGGVDSSVAGARLLEAGPHVVGVTMRLWGGESDTGCCSVADVDDARRVAQQLDIDHVVFNFGDDFDRHVVDPYVAAHVTGRTPNPCIECNRHVKFARLAERADCPRVRRRRNRPPRRGSAGRRTADTRSSAASTVTKDQSYVVHMLGAARPRHARCSRSARSPRPRSARSPPASACGPPPSPTARTCASSRRPAVARQFLGGRIPFRRADVVDTAGHAVGTVDALELVTIGQRRRLGLPGGGPKRYVVGVDHTAAIVTSGRRRSSSTPVCT